MTRPAKPIDSFGPEIFQALVEGSKREITVDLPYRQAVAFRQRANQLRAEMRRQGHEMYKVVSGTTLRVVWGEEAGLAPVKQRKTSKNVSFPESKNAPAKLIISPADKQFGEALRKAGVSLEPLSIPKPTQSPASTPSVDNEPDVLDILEGYLRR